DICNRIRKRRVKKSEPESLPPPPKPIEELQDELSGALGRILPHLPADGRPKLAAIDALVGVFRRAIGPPLEEALQGVLQATGGPTKFAVVHHDVNKANKVRRDPHYAILDPETKLPASVMTHRRNSQTDDGCFPRLQDRRKGEGGKVHKSASTRNLAPLKLVDPDHPEESAVGQEAGPVEGAPARRPGARRR